MTPCFKTFVSCFLPFSRFPNRWILQDQIYGPRSPRNRRLRSNRDFGLHESILLPTPSFPICESAKCWLLAMCPISMDNQDCFGSQLFGYSLLVFPPKYEGFFLQRWVNSFTTVVFGTSQVLDHPCTLSTISSSRLKLFSNFFCTPCRVLHKIFCDFAWLENFQGSQFPYVLQWTFSYPPGNLTPFLLRFVRWTYNILGTLLTLDSTLRRLLP
jgi:hypothetical protein